MKQAILAGATGLVGRHLLSMVSKEAIFDSIISLVRRPVESGLAGVEDRVVDFSRPSFEAGWVPDHFFCCLGTTMKRAGSEAAFRQVDYEFPMALARLCQNGKTHFHVITAMGSDAKSAFFYNRVKGDLERDLTELGLPRLTIYRPSLILGERPERRSGESLAGIAAKILSPAMLGPMRKYRAIDARCVASSMLSVAKSAQGEAVRIILSDEMQDMCNF